ncbi:MAG: amino acid permease [Deltaproteobacteria bacterium]|nr:amino acid permease [Deltaproteobacteria bacterium]
MRLKKELSLIDVFAIAAGAMISSGLFVLPGLVFARVGPAMILSYLIAAILIIPSMLAKAELATAMPKAGGTYFFIERSLGPVMGTYGGLANWFSLSFKSAFALIGIEIFAKILIPGISEMQIKIIAVAFCLLFALLNIFSVKLTGRVQVVLVFCLLAVIVLYIGRGFISTHPDRYIPFMPTGIWSVFSAAGLVFISFGGLTKIASVAEEVKNPSRDIPLGMFLAFCVVSLLYILAAGVTVGIVDGIKLGGSSIPLSLGAREIMGVGGFVVLSVAAVIAFVTTANAGILAASRSPMSMSRDQLLPGVFSKVNKHYKTPHIAILFTTGFMIVVILFLSLEDLVKTASTLMIILFMMVNISLIVMRESKIQNYQPKFRAPFYPWLSVAALISYTFLLFGMGLVPLLISGGFYGLGCIGYWSYSRIRVHRKSALMHFVERITARELKSKTLEKELREIVIERDEIIEDRFDMLIKQCEIIDLPGSMPLEGVFQKIAEILARRMQSDRKVLFSRFMEREKQSGTVIGHGLAIPHVIVPGAKKLEIVLVRCRKGLQFSGSSQPVHTMFILAGSMDERNYHLRALMAIAQIAKEAEFEKKWLAARNEDELRDVILLSSRARDRS